MDATKNCKRGLQIALFVFLPAIMLLCVIGVAASPRLDGHPLLLSPDLARETGYLRFVAAQIDVLQQSHEHLAQALEEGAASDNLLALARGARVATEDALDVLTAGEREAAPPELASLGLALENAATAYAEAGRRVVQFVNTPTAEAQAAAASALGTALAALQETRDRWERLAPR